MHPANVSSVRCLSPGLAPTALGVATDRPLRSYNAVINSELRAASLAHRGSYQNSTADARWRAGAQAGRAAAAPPAKQASALPLRPRGQYAAHLWGGVESCGCAQEVLQRCSVFAAP